MKRGELTLALSYGRVPAGEWGCASVLGGSRGEDLSV